MSFRYLYLLLICFPFWLKAQNIPYANIPLTEYVSSEHFDVYYTSGNQSLAEKTVRMAEMARSEVGFLYDYRPSSRYILLCLNDGQAMLQSQFSKFTPNYFSGTVPLPQLDATVVLPSQPNYYYFAVKQQVAALMLKEFDYGQDLPQVIQSELLNYQPQWFYEGLTDYVANGWLYEDEMFLQSIPTPTFLEQALQGNGRSNRVVRKSVWFYIAHEYGPQKFAELLYLSKLSRSVETAIISVLGIRLQTFTDRWLEFTIHHIDNLEKGRRCLDDVDKTTLLPPKGYEIVNFAFAEKAQKVAAWLNKEGKYSLFIYDLEAASWQNTGISMGFPHYWAEKVQVSFPISFSPNGETIASILWKENTWKWLFYKLESEEITKVTPDSTLQKVFSIAYSHNSKRLAISALKNGKTDIYIGNADGTGFKPITNDGFDDMQPSWGEDDNMLYFVSNRDTNLVKVKNIAWDYFKKHTDIFSYSFENEADTFHQITHTPNVSEQQAISPNGYEAYFLSEESGLFDLHRFNIFQGLNEYLTAFDQSIDEVQIGEKQIAITTWAKGKKQLHILPFIQNAVSEPIITEFRSEYYTLLETQKIAKSLVTLSNDTIPLLQIIVNDSSQTKIRYYIFDDEVSDNHVVKIKPNKLETEPIPAKENYKKLPLEWGKINVTQPSDAIARWRTEYLHLGFVYHPLSRFGISLGAAFQDLQNNHRLEAQIVPYLGMLPYVNLGSADANIRYTYLKKKADFFVEMEGKQRMYVRESTTLNVLDSVIYKFEHINIKGGIKYPLSHYAHLQVEGALHFLKKNDLRLVSFTPPNDQKNTLASLGFSYHFNNIQQQEDFQFKGMMLQGYANYYLSMANAETSFGNLQFSARKYQPLFKHIVFAANLQSSFSFGHKQTYFMGNVDNWLLGTLSRDRPNRPAYTGAISTDVTEFSFNQFVMPMRGFRFNARNGSKYILTNWELRIPITRMIHQGLQSDPLYSWELIPFFDMGTVWKYGNPFSQRNPTDVQMIIATPVTVQLQTLKSPFLFALGSGVKARLMNYTLRTDIAWGIDDGTFQKPLVTVAMGKAF